MTNSERPPNSYPGPTISVVMPSYNDGHFLESAIERYMTQTRPPDEIIVVVDGSTDDSIVILDQLKKSCPVLQVIHLRENVGINEATNLGVAEAKGKYLRLSSTHDPIHKEFLEKMVCMMIQYPQAAIGFCDPGYITEEGKRIPFKLRLSKVQSYLSVTRFQKILQVMEFTIPSASTLFLLDSFKKNGGFQSSFGHHADWFINFSCAFDSGVVYMPKNWAFYRIHEDKKSAVKKIHFGTEVCILRKILERLMNDEHQLKWQRFRGSGILPVMNIKMVLFLLCNPIGRKFLTIHCVWHCISNSVWSAVRPFTPLKVRDLGRLIFTPREGIEN